MTSGNVIQLAIAIPATAGLLWAFGVGIAKVGLILKEVTPNGGRSLKDRIIKLEQSHAELTKSQADQTQSLKRIERYQLLKDQRLERIENKIDARGRADAFGNR